MGRWGDAGMQFEGFDNGLRRALALQLMSLPPGGCYTKNSL
jgi:hypothetical protein